MVEGSSSDWSISSRTRFGRGGGVLPIGGSDAGATAG